MASPAVDISVDPATGVWTTDGLPMLYVPRHFLMGMLETVSEAIGQAVAEAHFYTAGFTAAAKWCEAQAALGELSGMAVFHFYMRRLSERGWGLFDGSEIDPHTGTGRVILRHSSFVAHSGLVGRKVCQFCAGWAPGALSWVGRSLGQEWRLRGEELRCAAEGHPHCELIVMADNVRPAMSDSQDCSVAVQRSL